ncbi:MAG: Na/Pi cotransporter family protein, partial [Lachnospiraceae bacterium]|nr:Na/Pi cotransporter family protein [Lachnospiraceae bacterium]
MEQKIDDMTVTYRESHLNRMREGKCSEEACVLYSELLTDFERIGDHALNIAQAYSKMYVAM